MNQMNLIIGMKNYINAIENKSNDLIFCFTEYILSVTPIEHNSDLIAVEYYSEEIRTQILSKMSSELAKYERLEYALTYYSESLGHSSESNRFNTVIKVFKSELDKFEINRINKIRRILSHFQKSE